MYQPESTYRIQIHKDFTFSHLEAVIPYLDQLGIKTIYASPVFAAVPGSTHGYDGIDPNRINPEIGTLEQLYSIAAELKKRGMGWLQDFVPNHMAYTPQNAWLCDFLEKGKMSVYDSYFDKNPDEPLMAPFLGAPLEQVIDASELSLVFSRGKLQLRYAELEFPLNYTAYADILGHEVMDGIHLSPLLAVIEKLSQVTDKTDFGNHWDKMLDQLNAQLSGEQLQDAFHTRLATLSNDHAFLQQLSDLQFYRLCYWQETMQKINYRRFFTINGLICMHIQHKEVFDDYHRLLLQLVKDDIIQGIRIDHIDGLYDPEGYLERLREQAGEEVYIVVEKILEEEEELPRDWPVQGTTGYDFLVQVNNLFTNTAAIDTLDSLYRDIAGEELPEAQMIFHYKQKILQEKMGGELANLLRTFLQLPGLAVPEPVTQQELRDVIATLLICCPVYRFYPAAIPLEGKEAASFSDLILKVKEQGSVSGKALDFFRDCFVLRPLNEDADYAAALLHFWRRCMQLSGPLMAKGVEDTLLYNYVRFTGVNEVGGNPFLLGMPAGNFHRLMQERQARFPMSLNATATHDTKRGEDARARLQLLSAHPLAWKEMVKDWMTAAQSDEYPLLSARDHYFLLQVMVAALPFEKEGREAFRHRLLAYLEKAAREAGSHSGWEQPDTAYETQLAACADAIIAAGSKRGKIIRSWLNRRQGAVAIQSLAQLVVKCTCPGIPDIYQGTEYWDLSFVDPDNRRPADYASLAAMLEKGRESRLRWTKAQETDPAMKLGVLHQLLQLRKQYPDLFLKGSYEPVAVSGHHLSFIRRYRHDWLWVTVPLAGNSITSAGNINAVLPEEAPDEWQHVFTGAQWDMRKDKAFKKHAAFPVQVWKGTTAVTRKAGILLPLFSLPSPYGTGGMGKEAYSFIGFLARSGQKVWQLLPLNPVLEENFYSPYAAVSAFAGEPMYIDPERMAEDGFPVPPLKDSYSIHSNTTQADYGQCREDKHRILQAAWKLFKESASPVLQRGFDRFRERAAGWLDNYALFVVLKRRYDNEPWYRWPEPYRSRDSKALAALREEAADQYAFEQWQQFVWERQWTALREYALLHDISLVGDVPFYMNNDSADVWAHQQLFQIGADGAIKMVAGVPPDYFSDTGQLWGMPVYDWEAMAKDGYAWWLQRLQRNAELYDTVRLDHFRAFYDYWEVPGTEKTAIHGQWRKGPQDELFELIQQHFPDMPFIAEDLGEIHEGVFRFKDKYALPGMHILQFGFDPYQPGSRDLPPRIVPNSVVYTGTHDNNTVAGWFQHLKAPSLKALERYAGYPVTEENAADALCRIAYSTAATTAILPMQDVLGLDEDSRINTPSTTGHNWTWRLEPGQLTLGLSHKILGWVKKYKRRA